LRAPHEPLDQLVPLRQRRCGRRLARPSPRHARHAHVRGAAARRAAVAALARRGPRLGVASRGGGKNGCGHAPGGIRGALRDELASLKALRVRLYSPPLQVGRTPRATSQSGAGKGRRAGKRTVRRGARGAVTGGAFTEAHDHSKGPPKLGPTRATSRDSAPQAALRQRERRDSNPRPPA
jgi:hypothetical protein